MRRAEAHFVEAGGNTQKTYYPAVAATTASGDYTDYFIGTYFTTPTTYKCLANATTEEAIDTTWGTDGFWGHEVGGTGTIALTGKGLLQLDDGRVLIAFSEFVYDGRTYMMAMINTDGTLDTTWGTDGFLSFATAAAYWSNTGAMLEDNDGNIHVFAQRASPGTGYFRIDSNGENLITIAGQYDALDGLLSAAWTDSDKTRIIAGGATSPINATGGGYDYANLMAITPAGAVDTTWTGNLGTVGFANSDIDAGSEAIGIYSINMLSDGGFTAFGYSARTLVKMLADGSALDTTWGTDGVLAIGTSPAGPVQSNIAQDGDTLYVLTCNTIAGVINNTISKVDSTGTVLVDTNIVTANNDTYHSIQVINDQVVLGTRGSDVPPAQYNVELWSQDLVYESGFDITGVNYVYFILPDEFTRETVDVSATDEYWTETDIGYGHLEGETVSILADGVVYPDQVVTDGDIDDTDFADATEIHIGLKYESELQPMRPVFSTTMGTTAASIVGCHSMGLSVHNSDGVQYGKDTGPLYEININEVGLENTSEKDGLFTGDLIWTIMCALSVMLRYRASFAH